MSGLPTLVSVDNSTLGDFGPLVIATDLSDAVLATLIGWLPTYLAQIERERAIAPGSLPRPQVGSIDNTLNDTEFLDHQLPAIIVTNSGFSSARRHPDFTYEATSRVTVDCVVRGRVAKETIATSALFEGCLRRIVLQQGAVPGAARAMYVSSSFEPVTGGQGRYLAASKSVFDMAIDEVVQGGRAGPVIPDAVTYLPGATVTAVTTDVETE